jgi:hypothetical protein
VLLWRNIGYSGRSQGKKFQIHLIKKLKKKQCYPNN